MARSAARGGRRHFEDAPGVEHVVAGEAVERGHQAERAVESFGGPEVMKLPAPCRASTTPTAASERRPARTEGRLTLICRASSRSGGKRSPGLSCPA